VSIVFSRSLRSIETDGYGRAAVAFAIAFGLAAAWAGWFLFARVAVVEVAETARLEVDLAAHGIEAATGGRITRSRLVLGQEVQEGDVLVELDAEPLRLSVNEERAKADALGRQIVQLQREIAAEARILEEQRGVAQSRLDEADARRREAETSAILAATEATRAARLYGQSLASESDAIKAKADADQKRAVADGTKLAAVRIEAEQRVTESERTAQLARLRADLAQLDGQRSTSEATIRRLEYEIERHEIRAPIAGRLGDVATVRVGAVIKEGEQLGAVIPKGTIRIVAEFLPGDAIGRIRPGQSARMRPEGFPWTQYGMLEARVRRVANEPRSGHIRVELDVSVRPDSPIPIQHGLPGTLEVEVERVSPAALVARTAGRRLSVPARNPAETKDDHGESTAQAPVRP
jgi:membrane fusion protein (multidrug efflux system)